MFRTLRRVELGRYILSLAIEDSSGSVSPFWASTLWLGEEVLDPNWWLFVYTGPGQRRSTTTNDGEPATVVHWNRRETVFHDSRVVPVLFEISSILTTRSEEALRWATTTTVAGPTGPFPPSPLLLSGLAKYLTPPATVPTGSGDGKPFPSLSDYLFPPEDNDNPKPKK